MASQPKHKPLLPTLKEKKRYLLYQLHAQATTGTSAGKQLERRLNATLGVFDAAAAGLLTITYDGHKKRGIIKTSNDAAGKVRAAMLLIDELDGQPLMAQPLLTTGILQKAKQAM